MYNPQIHHQQPQYYHQQMYGAASSSTPYYYGYSVQAAPRGTFSTPQAHRMPAGPSYLYYPTTPIEGSFSAYRPIQQQPVIRQPSPSPSGNIFSSLTLN